MFATKHTQGLAHKDFHPRSSLRAARKTRQRTSKSSRSGPIATAPQITQARSTAPVSAAAPTISAPVAPNTGKKVFLTRYEQRKHDRKALRKLESSVRFVDVPSADKDSPTVKAASDRSQRVSKAQALRFEQARKFEENEDAGQQEDDLRPIASTRDMKAYQQLVWKNNKKQRTKERRQDRA